MRFVLVLFLGLAGCGSHTYAPLASHTVATDSRDVVWLLEDASRVVRCWQPPRSRPVCVRAEVR